MLNFDSLQRKATRIVKEPIRLFTTVSTGYQKLKADSLQQNARSIAPKVNEVYLSIFEKLNSEHISSQVSHYFQLNIEHSVGIKKIIAGICHDNRIPAINFMADPEIFTQFKRLLIDENIKHSFNPDFSLNEKNINQLKTLIVELNISPNSILPSAISIHTQHITNLNELIRAANQTRVQVPFTNYEDEPDKISQIKKFLNAIHYFILALNEMARRPPSNLIKLLRSPIQEYAYVAGQLITHMDIDIKKMFSAELDMILPLFAKLQTLCDEKVGTINTSTLDFKAGEITGVTVKHLRPLSKDADYNFLTKFSGDLPGYLHKFTKKIEEYSLQIKEDEPSLNQDKLGQIQAAALELLNDLENLEGNSLFISIKFLNYIHIICNIITLSQSSLEQLGKLSEASQELIRDKLKQIKYDLFPSLFSFADYIEINLMLEPGTISKPLRQQISALYQAILFLPKKMMDFSLTGPELLVIEDRHFFELRLAPIYKRLDNVKKDLYKIEFVENAINDFFETLEEERYQNIALYNLPQAIRQKLQQQYKIFKEFVIQLNGELHNKIRDSLLGNKPALYSRARWQQPAIAPDHIPTLISEYRPRLNKLILKKKESLHFDIRLMTDSIQCIHTETPLHLYPQINTTPNIYLVDEENFLTTPPPKEYQQLEKFVQTTSNAVTHFLFPDKVTTPPEVSSEQTVLQKAPELTFIHNQQGIFLENLEQLSAGQAYDLSQWYDNKYHKIRETNKAIDTFLALLNTDALLIDELTNLPQEKKAAHTTLCIEFNKLLVKEKIKTDELETHFMQFLQANTKNKIDFEIQLTTLIKSPKITVTTINNEFVKLLEGYDEKTNILQEGFIRLLKEKGVKENIFKSLFFKKLDAQNINKDALNIDLLCLLKKHRVSEQLLDLSLAHYNIKNKLFRLYVIFQPYFPEIKHDPIHHFLTRLISERSLVTTRNYAFEEFFELTPESVITFQTSLTTWETRSLECLTYANRRYAQEYQSEALQKYEIHPRALYFIKHTNYSKNISEFRIALFKITSLFNQAIQEELVRRFPDDELPFPEMETRDTQLAECMQVRVIKELYNSLYHLEQVARALEELNDSSFKATYFKHLFQAYNHLNDIIEVGKRLSTDTHNTFMAQEIMRQIKRLYTTFLQHSDAYKVDYHEIIPVETTIEYNPLWYTLNALYLGPNHFRLLQNTHTPTATELSTLQQQAKRTTLNIEAILRSSNSYFKLFLQTPNMFFLYQELTKKLNEFTTTAHGAVLNNLDKLRPNIFTPMLLEADRWEDKIGLKPGSVSEPLRKITDEYFKGLLHPHNLHSGLHAFLIFDKKPLNERVSQIHKQCRRIKQNLDDITTYFEDIQELYHLIKHYEQGTLWEYDTESNIQRLYQKILPKLNQLKLDKKIDVRPSSDPNERKNDQKHDVLCNQRLSEYEPRFTEVRAWITACHHYYCGLKATHRMELKTAQEKLAFLHELKKTQAQEKITFIDEYTHEAFNKHLDFYCNRPIGLEHIDKEYEEKLKSYLLCFKEEIISLSKSARNINQSIKNLLRAKISTFEAEHYHEYYHLDLVMDAVARFKSYFSQSTKEKYSIESIETLGRKSLLVDEILAISKDIRKNVPDRLKAISDCIKNPNFQRVLLAHKHVNKLSFLHLKMCFLYLLEVIHVYTSPRKQLLHNMKKAVNSPPSINTLINRFGLFAQPAPNQLPAEQHPEPRISPG